MDRLYERKNCWITQCSWVVQASCLSSLQPSHQTHVFQRFCWTKRLFGKWLVWHCEEITMKTRQPNFLSRSSFDVFRQTMCSVLDRLPTLSRSTYTHDASFKSLSQSNRRSLRLRTLKVVSVPGYETTSFPVSWEEEIPWDEAGDETLLPFSTGARLQKISTCRNEFKAVWKA